jgi:hypothetical protein
VRSGEAGGSGGSQIAVRGRVDVWDTAGVVVVDGRNSSSIRRGVAGRDGRGVGSIGGCGITHAVVDLPSRSLICDAGTGCGCPGVDAVGVSGSRSTKLAPSLFDASAGYDHCRHSSQLRNSWPK